MKQFVRHTSDAEDINIHPSCRLFKRRQFEKNIEPKNDVDNVNSNTIRAGIVPTSLMLTNFAILGDSTVSLIVAFLLLLIAIIFQQYTSIVTQQQLDIIETIDATTYNSQNHRNHAITATTTISSQTARLLNEFTTYESLGPLPDEILAEQKNKNHLDSLKIYEVTEGPLMITPNMI